MRYREINWPVNPQVGDKISAFKGGAWVWDGCAWTHTCCPVPSCDIRENGLNVGITFLSPLDGYYLDLPATQVYCLEYQGNDVWTLPLQFEGEGINLAVRFEYGQWVFVSEGTDFTSVIATLSGSEPVGIWEANNIFDSPAEVVSECGCVSTICLSLKKNIYDFGYEAFVTMFPFIEYVPGSLSGNVLGYSLPLSTEVAILPFNGEWYLISKDEELLAVLPGVYPGLPVGTGWVPISVPSEAIIETVEGSCPCEPIVNGITLAMELDAEGGPETIYVNFKPASETLYEADGLPDFNISFSGGVWSINLPNIGVLATLSGESPLGTGWVLTGYAPENFPPILSIVTSCGTGPDNYGCLGYLTNGLPQSIVEISFSRVVTGGGIIYIALGDNYQIVPTGPNTWEIQGDSGTIATATGPINVPPFGLTWTILDPGIDQLGFDRACPKFEIPSYSFSAKFSAVSSLDLTSCFLDSNGNDCATLINWGDGTIDSNLTHTYLASGDYVISVVCEDAIEIIIDQKSVSEFYYALPIGLQSLGLGGNQIVDFNPSIALPIGLQNLYLSSNQIVDFNPSIALPIGLLSLDLNKNQIVDFNPSIALPIGLQFLGLGGNQIVDFNPSIALPIGLQTLGLYGNQIVDFNPSIALPIGLQNLGLSSNQIVDFNPSIALPIGLQGLGLDGNQIVDFNPSIALPIGLQNLGLSSNQIVDFNPSIALPIGLQSLVLDGNQIVDFNPSIALPIGLQSLDLYGNQIVDFNPSIALPIGLQSLYLDGNQIVDFNPSIALPIGLQLLGLGGNQMTIAGYTASETWANAQPSFTSSCNIYFNDNIDSVSGTDLETILISKNCTINA